VGAAVGVTVADGALGRVAVGGVEVKVGAGALGWLAVGGGRSGVGAAGARQAALARAISPSRIRRKAVENLIVMRSLHLRSCARRSWRPRQSAALTHTPMIRETDE
jgi:hypothetical protein